MLAGWQATIRPPSALACCHASSLPCVLAVPWPSRPACILAIRACDSGLESEPKYTLAAA